MFAPYCPTCTRRQLLGVRRLVAGNWERGGTMYVRCDCGTIVAADNPPPEGASGRVVGPISPPDLGVA